MTRTFDFRRRVVGASGINPFDKSYNALQFEYDSGVMEMLCTILNITLNVINTPLITDLGTYEINPNIWAIEQIINGSSELSSTTLILTPESPTTVKYSIGIGTFRPQLYYRARSVREENNIYVIPFSSDVWICLMSLLLIITVALIFILGRETELPHNTPYDIIARIADQKHDEGIDWKSDDGEESSEEAIHQRERWEFGEIVIVTVGALCQQGSARDPSTSAARMLLLVLFVLAVLIYTAYSASVISLISLLPDTDEEQHLNYLNSQEKNQIFMHDTNFFRHQFQPPFNNLEFTTLEHGLKEAIEGKSAFVGDKDISLTFLHKEAHSPELRCLIGRVFLGIEYQKVFVLRNTSEYQEPLNYNILRLRQYGLLSRTKRQLFNAKLLCSFKERSSLSGFVSIDISDIKPALNLLALGLAISSFVLFLEYFSFYSFKFLVKIFGRSWRQVDAKVENILKKWQKRRKFQYYDRKILPYKIYDPKLTNELHEISLRQKLKWFLSRGTFQPPFSN